MLLCLMSQSARWAHATEKKNADRVVINKISPSFFSRDRGDFSAKITHADTQHETLTTFFLGGIIALHFIIFSLALNILKRRRAEADILKTQRRFNTIMETAKEGFVEFNAQAIVQEVNPEMCAMIGRIRQEIIGSPFIAFLAPAAALQFQRHLQSALAGRRCTFEIFISRPDQATITCLFNLAAIQEERHADIGCFAMVSDITEIKALESQLLQAQKMETIGNLAGGIAHDFNNRLQTISGYTQLLLYDKGRTPEDIAKLTAIERSVRSSCELIDQLLMFSRKIASKLAPTDLNREVRQIQKILERTMPRMIEIQLKLSPDLAVINADPPQIEQVLMNLSINAGHAMPRGGKLMISTENVILDELFCKQHIEAAPGKYVRLRVEDNGLGMTGEILAHIFEPFFTTKFPGKGTGLGLSMVHGIIKNHNGYITCSSMPGQGACFDIYFPQVNVDPATLTLNITETSKLTGGHETLLLVEDDEGNLDVGRTMLERFGYTVLSASEYEEALSKFKRNKESIALTILDLNMPGIGGEPILKAILAMAPHAKVLIASGFSGLAVRHALMTGAADYIRKPFQIADLLLQVRKLIDT